jgi:hypothetical protein
MKVVFLAILLAVGGCSSGTSMRMRGDAGLMFADEDLATPNDLGMPSDDLARSSQDMAVRGDLSGGADLAAVGGLDLSGDLAVGRPDLSGFRDADGGLPGTCGVRINEIMVATYDSLDNKRTSEEFVELYNSCSTSRSLNSWELHYRSWDNNNRASAADTVLVADLNLTIPGKGFLVWGGQQLASSLRNGLFASPAGMLADDKGGGVALIDNNGNTVDQVAYGAVVANHNFLDGTAAPFPPVDYQPGNSIARLPDGYDTDDNGADFFITTTPTPKAANVYH